KVLSELYAEFGHEAEAQRYGEEAEKYSAFGAAEKRPAAAPVAVGPEASVAEAPASTVQEFVLEVPEEFFEAPSAEPSQAAAMQEPALQETSAPEPVSQAAAAEEIVAPGPEVKEVKELAPEPPAEQPQEIEIDVSHEWESMLSVEPEAAAKAPAAHAPPVEEPVAASVEEEPVAAPAEPVVAGPDPAVVAGKVQEIRFYISQAFWDMAQAGIHDLAETAPDYPNLDQLRADVAAGEAEAARAAEAARLAAAEAARAEAARVAAAEAARAEEAARRTAAEAAA